LLGIGLKIAGLSSKNRIHVMLGIDNVYRLLGYVKGLNPASKRSRDYDI